MRPGVPTSRLAVVGSAPLADQVRARARDTLPTWAERYADILDGPLFGEIALWRAAQSVPDDDRRLAGPPPEADAATAYHRNLNHRINQRYTDVVRSWSPRSSSTSDAATTRPWSARGSPPSAEGAQRRAAPPTGPPPASHCRTTTRPRRWHTGSATSSSRGAQHQRNSLRTDSSGSHSGPASACEVLVVDALSVEKFLRGGQPRRMLGSPPGQTLVVHPRRRTPRVGRQRCRPGAAACVPPRVAAERWCRPTPARSARSGRAASAHPRQWPPPPVRAQAKCRAPRRPCLAVQRQAPPPARRGSPRVRARPGQHGPRAGPGEPSCSTPGRAPCRGCRHRRTRQAPRGACCSRSPWPPHAADADDFELHSIYSCPATSPSMSDVRSRRRSASVIAPGSSSHTRAVRACALDLRDLGESTEHTVLLLAGRLSGPVAQVGKVVHDREARIAGTPAAPRGLCVGHQRGLGVVESEVVSHAHLALLQVSTCL